ncbi:MAG: hypothetical protein WCF26_07800 [Candidatus Sulfotelmatobacter sp.]
MFHRRIALIIFLVPIVLALPSDAQRSTENPTSSASQSSASSGQNPNTMPTHNSELEPLMTGFIPHPYACFGPSLMGAGYAPVAWRGEAGLNVESTPLVIAIGAAYDNGRLVNDAGQSDPNGHDRYLDVAGYFRPRSLLFSGRGFVKFGWRWSQLSTTNYTKTSNRPQIGGGFDIVPGSCSFCRNDFSMRIVVNWVLAGNDWQNGSHGPEITLFLPSPREQRHWFFQERVGVYRFHETVTDRGNIPLTLSQGADRTFGCYVTFGIMYRS